MDPIVWPLKYPRTLQEEWTRFAHEKAFKGSRFTFTLVEPDLLSRITPVALVSGTGSLSYVGDTNDGQGVIRLKATSAGAGGVRILGNEAGTATYGLTSLKTATKIALGMRMRMSTGTVDSGARGCREMDNTLAGAWGFGVDGAVSTTKFVAWVYDDTATRRSMVSTVSIDTSWHRFLLWRDGNTTYFSVDDETPVAGVSAHSTANAAGVEQLRLVRSTAAADQQFDFRSIFTAKEA